MNNNTASQFMDKQIMDLSNAQNPASTDNNNISSNNDFINLMNHPSENKDDIVPSYDFMPIRPAVGSSSPKAVRSSNLVSDGDAPLRTWNSFDSKTNTSPVRNYISVEADEPAKFVLGKNHKPSNAPVDMSLVSEIDRTMKKYMDNLMHSVDHMSARLSQLETRTRNLENFIDDLKVSVEKTYGSTDMKMSVLEDMLSEVQSGVQVIKDKQEIVEAQLQIAKLQVSSKMEQVEIKDTAHSDSTQTGVSANQQFSTLSPPHPTPTLPPPNAPPSPPQQNLQHTIQLPNQFPQKQVPPVASQFPQSQAPSVTQRESYFPSPGQAPENLGQQYQIPPPPQQQHHHHAAPPPPQHQYQPPPQPQYSQPPPQPQYSQLPPTSQPHPSFSAVNPSLPQPPLSHHPEETLHAPAPTYSQGIRPPPSHPSTGVPPPPSQQYYGQPTSNVYEPPSIRPGPGYSGTFAPSSGHGEPYPYSSSPSQYGNGSPMKPQLSSQSSVNSYPQLPTARILPQALPTASGVGSGSGSGGSSNRVPIDDVVDRVTNMGFPRDQVRATVRKLTENGQAVDLNVVLDKLMNGGDGQAPRPWFGR